jgi:hypothetical protein
MHRAFGTFHLITVKPLSEVHGLGVKHIKDPRIEGEELFTTLRWNLNPPSATNRKYHDRWHEVNFNVRKFNGISHHRQTLPTAPIRNHYQRLTVKRCSALTNLILRILPQAVAKLYAHRQLRKVRAANPEIPPCWASQRDSHRHTPLPFQGPIQRAIW